MKIKGLLITILAVLALSAFALAGCRGSAVNIKKEYPCKVVYDFQGGILDTGTAAIDGLSIYSLNFKEDALICKPEELPGYEIRMEGYSFAGWYKEADCVNAWDFAKDKVTQTTTTLYAKWQKNIAYTYSMYYVEGEQETCIYTLSVAQGDKFNKEIFKTMAKRQGYTFLGDFYNDASMQTLWDDNFTHPGGETDLDIKVYGKYIEGDWQIVKTYDDLKGASGNIYLMNNIDCDGKDLTLGDNGKYSAVFQGNGYKVSNFTVRGRNALTSPLSIFVELEATAQIKNVTFENVTYSTLPASGTPRKYGLLKIAALAVTAQKGCVVENVAITGKYVNAEGTEFINGYTPDLTLFQNAFYDTTTVTPVNFTANITVD